MNQLPSHHNQDSALEILNITNLIGLRPEMQVIMNISKQKHVFAINPNKVEGRSTVLSNETMITLNGCFDVSLSQKIEHKDQNKYQILQKGSLLSR